MPRKRRPPPRKGFTITMNTRTILWTAAAVGTLTGAIAGVAKAWPVIEPWLIAHRGYVLEHVGGVQATTNELLIWKSEDSKSRAKGDAEAWTIQLQKERDPQTRALIQRRIQDLNQDIENYDSRIRRLKGQ